MTLHSLARFAATFVAFSIAGPTSGQPAAPKKYAVLVGVNDYQHEKLPKLQYAVKDVEDLATLLAKTDYKVTLLCDKSATADHKPTKANIERELKSILERCRRGDTVILGFAGHGMQF